MIMDTGAVAMVTIGVQILGFMFTGIFWAIIKFNDLQHLDCAVQGLVGKVGELAERVSKLEGKTQINV